MINYEKPWLSTGETLVCFGDSITASVTGYTAILQKHLAKKNIKVINAGRGGDKTPWALTRLESDVIALKPDAVSIFLGTNDCAVGRAQWADEPMVSPEAYKSNLIWIIHLCRLKNINKFSITPPLGRFEGQARLDYGDIIAEYCSAAREAASIMKVQCVPADAACDMERQKHNAGDTILLTVDGIHLNEKGNSLVADTMLTTWGLQ